MYMYVCMQYGEEHTEGSSQCQENGTPNIGPHNQDEADGSKRRSNTPVRRKSKKTKTKSRSKKVSPRGHSVAQLVMALSCRGYQEQLGWLEAYLRDEAQDRAMDGQWRETLFL